MPNRYAALVLHGLEGSGKTELALAFARDNKSRYKVIWRVGMDNVIEDYAALAKALKLTNDNVCRAELVNLVLDNLCQKTSWLLIFDNVKGTNDVDSIYKYIPSSESGHVLITSRDSRDWDRIAKPLPIGVMKKTDAQKFLKKRTGESDAEAIATLADEMEYLPLALEQAGKYIRDTGCGVRGYLNLFRKEKTKLLRDDEVVRADKCLLNVFATSQISYQELKTNSDAIALLRLFAFLASDNISVKDLLRIGSESLPDDMPVLTDMAVFNEAIKALNAYSFVRNNHGIIKVHRLVQTAVQCWMTEVERKRMLGTALKVVTKAYDFGKTQCVKSLTPHISMVIEHAENCAIYLDEAENLAYKLGEWYFHKEEFRIARNTIERVLIINEGHYGINNSKAADIINMLGCILKKEGYLENADACDIWESEIRQNTPLTAHSYIIICKALGNDDNVRNHYTKVIAITQKTSKGNEYNYLMNKRNCGDAWYLMREYMKALQQYRDALKINFKKTRKKIIFGREIFRRISVILPRHIPEWEMEFGLVIVINGHLKALNADMD
nr:NB-ARC domain-containing protein [Methylomusa anaerophila]